MRPRPGSPPPERLGLALFGAALLAALAGVLLGGQGGAALFAAGAVGLPLGLLVAGTAAAAPRSWWLGVGGTVLALAAATAVVVTPAWSGRLLAGGWPAGALAALAGFWLLPLVLLGAAAAWARPRPEPGPADPGSAGEGRGDAAR